MFENRTISKKLTGNCNLFAMVNEEFENIQNALLESHEDISHINAQVTELFFVAIPSSNFSFRDFIKFANHDKIYMVVADQSDISTGSLTIEPPLTTAVSSSKEKNKLRKLKTRQ